MLYVENVCMRLIHFKFFSQIIILVKKEIIGSQIFILVKKEIIGMPKDFIETCVTCSSLLIEGYAM